MELIVDKNGTKEYYDEMLFVISRFNKYSKKPNVKAQLLTKFLFKYLIFDLLGIVLAICFYIIFHNNYFIFMMGAIVLIMIYTIILYNNAKKQINNYLNDTSIKRIIIDNDYIRYRNDSVDYKISLADIKYIIVNKYSVVFLPNNINTICISLSIEYLDFVKEALKDNKASDKLIFNN